MSMIMRRKQQRKLRMLISGFLLFGTATTTTTTTTTTAAAAAAGTMDLTTRRNDRVTRSTWHHRHLGLTEEFPQQPDLPFGDINVVVLTDIHTWVGGHQRQEPSMNADYGDILSFWEHLKAYADSTSQDLWFVNNGDWVHGTGLSANGDTTSLVPILEKMPWDAINCGNHELYQNEIVKYMTRPGGFVDWWGDRYLSANILVQKSTEDFYDPFDEDTGSQDDEDQLEPLGKKYKILHGRNSNLLVFGFLYNMEDPCDLIVIRRVEDVVKEKWFAQALSSEDYDAIMILAHMDLVDPLVDAILQVMRQVVGDTVPIQFITGHTHYRGVQQLDDMTNTVEFGRYLDTVGFVSFPTKDTAAASTTTSTNETSSSSNSTSLFKSMFVDTNVQTLQEALGVSESDNYEKTWSGKQLSSFIEKTQTKKGLLEEVGCAPQNYDFKASLDDPSSLWRLYRDEVIPSVFFGFDEETAGNDEDSDKDNTPERDSDDASTGKVMLLSKGSWRYNIYATSKLVVDDLYAVAPFNDTVMFLGTFEGVVINQLNMTLNDNHNELWLGRLPNYIQIGQVDNSKHKYELYTHEYNVTGMIDALHEIVPHHDITPQPTEYSSTVIWLSFVIENWDCNGIFGQLPDWLPKPNQLGNNMGDTNLMGIDNQTFLVVSVVLFLVLIFVCSCICCLVWCRCGSGHRSLTQEELNKFELVLDDQDDDIAFDADDEEEYGDFAVTNNGGGMENTTASLSDDAHQML